MSTPSERVLPVHASLALCMLFPLPETPSVPSLPGKLLLLPPDPAQDCLPCEAEGKRVLGISTCVLAFTPLQSPQGCSDGGGKGYLHFADEETEAQTGASRLWWVCAGMESSPVRPRSRSSWAAVAAINARVGSCQAD